MGMLKTEGGKDTALGPQSFTEERIIQPYSPLGMPSHDNLLFGH
jgi:hypothetical protein